MHKHKEVNDGLKWSKLLGLPQCESEHLGVWLSIKGLKDNQTYT